MCTLRHKFQEKCQLKRSWPLIVAQEYVNTPFMTDIVGHQQQPLSPGVRLYGHILQKGYQAGSVVGLAVVVPATVLYTRLYLKQPADLLQLLRRTGISCATGFAVTALLGALKVSQIDHDGLVDRAYRLQYNEGQTRTDRLAAVGGATGLVGGGLLLRHQAGLTAMHYVGAGAVGAAGGVLLHMLSRPQDQKSPNKMIHELRT